MRFQRAKDKLDEARVLIKNLGRVRDSISFRAQFLSAINSLRAVREALVKDGAHISGFNVWFEKPWKSELDTDELLRFIYLTRIEDFHRGGWQQILLFPFFNLEQLHFPRDLEPPPVRGAMLKITSEGAVWVVNVGKPDEYREPAVPRAGAKGIISVALKSPPPTHLGKPLTQNSPRAVLEAALRYNERMVAEAERFFSQKN